MKQAVIDVNSLSLEINKLLESLIQFEKILLKEADSLKESDTKNLITVISQKENISAEIETILSKLAKETKSKNFSINLFMQNEQFKFLPKSLKTTFATITQKVVNCHDQNIANGISIQTLNNLNQNFLQLFKSEDPKSKTYTSSGSSSINKTNSKPLGKA